MIPNLVIYLACAFITGGLISWLVARFRQKQLIAETIRNGEQRLHLQEKEAAARHTRMVVENTRLQTEVQQMAMQLQTVTKKLQTAESDLQTTRAAHTRQHEQICRLSESEAATTAARAQLTADLTMIQEEYNRLEGVRIALQEKNTALQEKLATQETSLKEWNEKLQLQFETMAGKMLDTKAEKFTELNKNNLRDILSPLKQNIDEFRKTVQEVYQQEAKERFSLEKEVGRLAALNQQITEETRNLTQALKGDVKTQGRWGEMILERILESSGLRKGEEYFLEHELKNDQGKALRSDLEGKKMRPDAIVKYPGNRNVIIDAKVSLNAFSRYQQADDPKLRQEAMNAHLRAIKNHIAQLSAKGYDDYRPALDFVMLFVPSEPAYIAAMSADPDLWYFAYEKRILLINPTNLITALKLVLDLWKREHQNQNAQAIAERGARLYDKFAGFVQNLHAIGDQIGKAQAKYEEACKQLSSGRDNLLSQAERLKQLGIKNKKELLHAGELQPHHESHTDTTDGSGTPQEPNDF